MKKYLFYILKKYNLSILIVPITILAIGIFLIFSPPEGQNFTMGIFWILILLPLILYSPLYILSDSYQNKIDAGSYILLSMYLNFYGIIIYNLKKRSIKSYIE